MLFAQLRRVPTAIPQACASRFCAALAVGVAQDVTELVSHNPVEPRGTLQRDVGLKVFIDPAVLREERFVNPG